MSTAVDAAPDPIRPFNSLFIAHDQASCVMEALNRLLKYGYGSAVDGKSAALVLLLGPSRSGKTVTLHKFISKFATEVTLTGEYRPIIMFGIPEKCTIKTLLTGLLIAFGDPAAEKGTQAGKLMRVAHHIREQKTRLIILDEGHHLIDSDSERIIYSVSESIKTLLNLGLCPIALSGMPHTADVVEKNPQLKGRLQEVVRLGNFRWSDPDDQKKFRMVLHMFDRACPFSERSGLGDPSLAYRIWIATDGLVGLVVQLLSRAIIHAIETSAPSLSLATLAVSFNAIHSVDQKPNPFLDKFDLNARSIKNESGPVNRSRQTKLKRGNRKNPENPFG